MSERCDIFAKAFNAGVPDGAPAVAYQSFTGSAAAFAAVALAARDRGVVLAVTAGLSPYLEWHALHEQCRKFTVDELSALALSISAYVYPFVRYNQSIKTAIYATTTAEELEKIVIDYDKAEVANENSQ